MPSLQLLSLEQLVQACPYYDASEVLTSAEGRREFARQYALSVLAWAGKMIDSAVASPTDAEELKRDMTDLIAERAHELEYDYCNAVIVAKRV